MSRRGLEFLAVFLSFVIIIVLFAGFDNLPRKLRTEISSERQQLIDATKQFQDAKNQVTGDLSADPDLFRARSMGTEFPARFRSAAAQLESAQRDGATLDRLLKANRRQDREQAERLLAEQQSLRRAALNEASSIRTEAQRWVDMKRNLPAELRQMESDHQTLQRADFGSIAATVERAQADWPDKKDDLEVRLASLHKIPQDAEQAWASSDAMRRQAEANNLAGLDYGALLSAAEMLHHDVAEVPARTEELRALTGQLYTSWDKILVDLQDRHSGGSRDYEEKIRTVKTRLLDTSGKKGETTSEESWVEISKATYQANEKNLGMAVGHKPPGKYDTEADNVPEPAGFAYMASPSQERNQYGYWDHSNGGNFWIWYGQYALLRDLLWGRSYQPIPYYEWESYRTARTSGQTYYGRDATAGAPKYGTHGTFTQQHYSESRYLRSSGGYKSSKYATGGLKRGESSSGQTFGGGSRSPSSGYRPRSSPSYRPSFRPPSGGRSFGRRR